MEQSSIEQSCAKHCAASLPSFFARASAEVRSEVWSKKGGIDVTSGYGVGQGTETLPGGAHVFEVLRGKWQAKPIEDLLLGRHPQCAAPEPLLPAVPRKCNFINCKNIRISEIIYNNQIKKMKGVGVPPGSGGHVVGGEEQGGTEPHGCAQREGVARPPAP